jgi:hypothetical protein
MKMTIQEAIGGAEGRGDAVGEAYAVIGVAGQGDGWRRPEGGHVVEVVGFVLGHAAGVAREPDVVGVAADAQEVREIPQGGLDQLVVGQGIGVRAQHAAGEGAQEDVAFGGAALEFLAAEGAGDDGAALEMGDDEAGAVQGVADLGTVETEVDRGGRGVGGGGKVVGGRTRGGGGEWAGECRKELGGCREGEGDDDGVGGGLLRPGAQGP